MPVESVFPNDNFEDSYPLNLRCPILGFYLELIKIVLPLAKCLHLQDSHIRTTARTVREAWPVTSRASRTLSTPALPATTAATGLKPRPPIREPRLMNAQPVVTALRARLTLCLAPRVRSAPPPAYTWSHSVLIVPVDITAMRQVCIFTRVKFIVF